METEREPGELPAILTVEQVADLVQIAAPVVRKLARQGELPGRRVGGQWRFSRDQLLAWIGNPNAESRSTD